MKRRQQRAIERERRVYYASLKERTVLAPIVDALEEVAMCAGKYGYHKLSQEPMRTDLARSELAQAFMQLTADGRKPQDTDTLIMLDNDHLHNRYTLPRLASLITGREEGRGIVGAAYVRRIPPYDPIAYVRGPDGRFYGVRVPENRLAETTIIGHGAIAIARWVFEDLLAAGHEYPLWRYEYIRDMPSEDMYFGKICEAAGISMWCDGGLVAPHHTHHFVTFADTDAYTAAHPELPLGKIPMPVNTEKIESEAIC